MSPAPKNSFFLSPAALSLLAGAAGFLANSWSLPLFSDTGIVFGLCFPLLAAVSCGPGWGFLAAIIAATNTVYTWGHPLGLIVFPLEAAAVGWLARYRRTRPLRADLFYWFLVGIPVCVIYVLLRTDLPYPIAFSLIAKLPLNGFLSAAIAIILAEFVCHVWPDLLDLQWTRSFSLRTFLFQRFGIHAAMPIAALGIYSGMVHNRHSHEEESRMLVNSALDAAYDVENHLGNHQLAIRSLANQLSLTPPGTPADLDRQLEAFRRDYPGFLTLLICDASGNVIATAADPSLGPKLTSGGTINVADRDYFQKAVQTKDSYVSDVFRGRGLGNDLIVALSHPVLDANGAVRLVIEGSLDLRIISVTISKMWPSSSRDLAVVDRRNHIVCSTGTLKQDPLSPLHEHQLWASASIADSPSFTHDHYSAESARPVRYLTAQARVSTFGWTVYVQEPLWRAQKPIAVFYLSVFIGAGSVTALSLLLARGTASIVTRPLEQLLEATHSLSRDEAAVPAVNTSGTPVELALLSRDVHEVALRLKQKQDLIERSNSELRELARTLDQRVNERTAELSEAQAAAESANRAKSEFLASMSHELRTPLNVVLGNTSLLEDGTMGPLNEKQIESLHGIEESGRHLLSLINDILDLSKVEAGMLELDHSDVSAIDICEASLRLVAGAAHRKGLQLEREFPPDEDINFVADGRRIKQVLVNLLSNAVKFTPEGGRVTLQVRVQRDENAIHFSVIDTGIGIAPELQAKLFRPFVQIDSRLSREYSGTGLGLALVKQLADLHGGSVALISAPGEGSTFRVSLPLRRDTASRAPFPLRIEPPKGELILHRPRLLVAEDHATNLAVMKAFFRKQECEVTYAHDGEEAVARAIAQLPDLILMDVQMPRMDGLEAIRLLRADKRTAGIPIICLTALAMDGDRELCLSTGANDYLCKPVSFPSLTRKINELIAARKAAATG